MLRVFVFSIIVCALCYWLYTPLPDEYEQPWRTQMLMAVFKLDAAWGVLLGKVYSILDWDRPAEYSLLALAHPGCSIKSVEVTKATFEDVEVTLYDPSGRPSGSKAVVYYHGGGWTWENEGYYSCYLREIAHRTLSLVVSVRYRLAPAHVFPAGVEDCVQATFYFMINAESYRVNPDSVVIAGDSAGGHLTAVVSQVLRDKTSLQSPLAQILICPATQAYDFMLPSYQVYASAPSLPRKSMITVWLLFLKGSATEQEIEDLSNDRHKPADVKKAASFAKKCDVHLIGDDYVLERTDKPVIGKGLKGLESLYEDPRMSPLLANDLRGLPQALVITAEVDVLRDDGVMYVTRLRQANNVVEHKHYVSAFHGFYTSLYLGIKAADDALIDVVSFINKL